MNGNDSNEEKKESMTMVVVRQVTNNKKKKKKHNNGSSCKSFDIGSLFSIPIVVCTQQQQKQQTNTTTTTTTDKSWTVIDVPSNCLLTLTTACTNKLANVCLYVAATADDEFVCIGSLTKQKAMTNIGIQVTSTSIKVKAEQTHTIFRNNTINSSTVPLAVNLFGTIQPTSTSSTAYSLTNQSTKDNNINNNHITATTTTTKISTDDEANTTTTTTPGSKKSDNDGNDNSESKRVSKKRKLSEDVDIKDNNNNNNNVTSENGEDPPIQKLTKKQRKKLAKQKALELEKALHGNTDEKKQQQQQKQKPSPTKKTKISPLTKERRLEGGLLVRDIILGTGSMAVKPGKKVSIHYEASLADTDQVFDRNQSKSNPLSFRVGTGQVIKGLERGLQGMRAGGERMLTIPPDLGYGKKGSGNVIPKNATLCFTVKLINVGGSGK